MEKNKTIKHNTNCIICNKELIYFQENKEVKCVYCQNDFKSNVHCINSHYVCDICHGMDGMDIIEKYCINTIETNPLKMAMELMKNPSINMHGPEHHYLVPAVLLASYYNATDETNMKPKKLAVAKSRAKEVKGGFCGFYGNCGAAVGTGIYISLILGATPLTKESWGLANLMTGTALISMGKIGGPRCCKRNVFTAIKEASKFTYENFNIKLYDYENEKILCSFRGRNKECLKTQCPYY